MTQLVVAAAVQATPVFLDRYTTVEKVVELTAKKGTRLPAATVDGAVASAEERTRSTATGRSTRLNNSANKHAAWAVPNQPTHHRPRPPPGPTPATAP
jgi:hypothetical protein